MRMAVHNSLQLNACAAPPKSISTPSHNPDSSHINEESPTEATAASTTINDDDPSNPFRDPPPPTHPSSRPWTTFDIDDTAAADAAGTATRAALGNGTITGGRDSITRRLQDTMRRNPGTVMVYSFTGGVLLTGAILNGIDEVSDEWNASYTRVVNELRQIEETVEGLRNGSIPNDDQETSSGGPRRRGSSELDIDAQVAEALDEEQDQEEGTTFLDQDRVNE
ncbi:hypothetical protein IAR50_006675 [Cryptococcus sp. DSM 104548]